MPTKLKFRKNRKLKSKMKGGNAEGPGDEAPGAPEARSLPTEKDAPVKSKSGGETDYGSLNIKYFTYGITSIGIMGVLWLFLSRSMIRHEYSEALSYSIIALAIFLSFFFGINCWAQKYESWFRYYEWI